MGARHADQPAAAFTGDTLFVAGCGNFNSGTAQQMKTALVDKICALPDDSQLFVGHEYTVKNLLFATTVEPDSQEVQDRLAWARARREAHEYTVPTTVGAEKATNPFVRCTQQTVLQYADTTDP